MFRTDLLSVIRSLNTIFTAIGICHTGYVYSMLARSTINITSMTNTDCCEYSIKTPDDGQYVCPKHVKVKVIPQQAKVAQAVLDRLRPRIFVTFGTTRVVGR